ncbi:UvrD-helicase domain-containing protein [Microbacterium paludicola]|uniref:UvrD-helicase domain-containing protein n=1 Tax=Microbacterium paludicola TaxID=300019 RepID=UPI0038791D71
MSLTDAAARQEIHGLIDENLFVDAGAGSGKTTALVERVVTSVLGPDPVPLPHTAVVTFTEKAGAELRDRLRERLERAEREARDPGTSARARQALEDLDTAAIGTLHSFAQRILAAFPIQAGMPPLMEVLDEVGSSVAFEARWAQMWRAVLDDDTLSAPLLFALDADVKPDHFRSLARAFGNDWDLIDSHVLNEPVRAFAIPDTEALVRQAILIGERAAECTDPSDQLLPSIRGIAEWAVSMRRATGDPERMALVRSVSGFKTHLGRQGNWPDVAGLRNECKALKEAADRLAREASEVAIRPLARAIAAQVRSAAQERVASGRLEFHDLLVESRELLRGNAGVRAALQQSYRRLLLDEFQDTDPIQIELAVRIAGGADATADDWRDVALPPGSLFVVGDPKQSIYRFRRASIETYLAAGQHFGRRVSLVTNFRTISPVLQWVNAVFAEVIREDPGRQPAYEPLAPHRDVVAGELVGPAVAVLGAQPHEDKMTADRLREAEAADVAAVIRTALAEGWTVYDEDAKGWRPVSERDIAILLPSRTSLPFLESALDAEGIAYRTESSSLVYQADEIRWLMAAARAIADPSDQLSCVTALRSSLFGCGDDDLFRYHQAGGRFTVSAPIRDELAETPVGRAMGYLNNLFRRSRWLTPAELLNALVVDRRVLEVAAATQPGPRARERWGRVRFVLDQARAWSDTQHGGLREYVAWAAHQAQDAARVAEALLPETDLDVVRIMTVHAAKGLEFGMVVLSGMTSRPNNRRGVQLLWGDRTYAVKLAGAMQTNDFADAAPLDEQMDSAERQRLLYVAATRARDHLIVSLHRDSTNTNTAARILAEVGAADAAGAVAFTDSGTGQVAGRAVSAPGPGLDESSWRLMRDAAVARAAQPAARTASGLEGTEPEVQWSLADATEPEEAEQVAGLAKGARDVELPPWLKGRYGNLIGRAVHGALQIVDGDATRIETAAAAQALAEGIPDLADAVARYVTSALSTQIVRDAFAGEHWSEMYVGTVEDDLVLEGFIDLVYRDADGRLVILDYKTDHVRDDAALAERATYYAPQLRAYERALEAATAERARAVLLFLRGDGEAARVVPVPPEVA